MRRPAVRTLVVDAAAPARHAIAMVIDMTDGFVLAGEATSGEGAVEWLAHRDAELVLMDVEMPGCGGVEAARRLAREREDLCVVLVTAYDLPLTVVGRCDPTVGVPCHAKDAFGPEVLMRVWRDWEDRHAARPRRPRPER